MELLEERGQKQRNTLLEREARQSCTLPLLMSVERGKNCQSLQLYGIIVILSGYLHVIINTCSKAVSFVMGFVMGYSLGLVP